MSGISVRYHEALAHTTSMWTLTQKRAHSWCRPILQAPTAAGGYASSFATATPAPAGMVIGAGGGSADYAETFATAKPAGPGQLGPGGSADSAETFATAKQAPTSSSPLGAPESFATAKVRQLATGWMCQSWRCLPRSPTLSGLQLFSWRPALLESAR